MKLYIENKKDILISEGFDIKDLLKNVAIVDYGEKIFKRFKEIINSAF